MYFYSVCMNAADCWLYFYYEVILCMYDLMNHELFYF